MRARSLSGRRSVRWRSLGPPILSLSLFFWGARSLRVHLQLEKETVPIVRRENEHNPTTTSRDGSALVSLASVPAKEREFRPGVYEYGHGGGALIIIGASVASDYHSPETLWLQWFALGDRTLVQTPTTAPRCSFDEDRVATAAMPPIKPWGEMEDEVFLCRVGGKTARFTLMPSNGIDSNTNNVIQVWRCPVVLSGPDLKRFRRRPADDVALAVEVVHQGSDREGGLTSVVKLYLPSVDPLVGVNRILSRPPKPFLRQRHNVTLCVVAHANGLVNLNEFVRYHHDVVGIDHIHVGVHTMQDGEENAAVPRVANRLLKPDIDAGRVSVSALWDTEEVGVRCGSHHYPMMSFYQQCLYRAKGTSEFAATWDLDEFLLLGDGAGTRRLPEYLRGIDHAECPDWCFVTIESYMAGGDVPEGRRTGTAALDYPLRDARAGDTYSKSVSRTKNAFLNSFHLPGACLPGGASDVTEAAPLHPKDGGCAFYARDARMVHVRGIQRRESTGIMEGDTVPNELQGLLASD